jgi:hypothetical protein
MFVENKIEFHEPDSKKSPVWTNQSVYILEDEPRRRKEILSTRDSRNLYKCQPRTSLEVRRANSGLSV